jgi:multimeric flavodoxin WrbA
MKTVLILGSSRHNGDTAKLTQFIQEKTNWEIVNLSDYNISYYDYEHKNATDDFLTLMERLLTEYDAFIFATPVYWYSMSGIMKVFFDRITDLITIRKELGRALKNKSMAAISTSIGNNLEESFWLPFRLTAEYLNMFFIQGLHTQLIDGEISLEDSLQIEAFIKKFSIPNS